MFSGNKKKPPNTWTFILIRDRQRTSLQFRIRPAYLLGAVSSVLGLIVTLVCLTQTYQATATSHHLARQEIHEKDAIIEKLQQELIKLSLQTEMMQEKMEQLQTWENEINRLVQPTSMKDDPPASKLLASHSQPAARTSSAKDTPSSEDKHPSQDGVGGAYYGTSRDELSELADQIKQQLDHLEKQIAAAATRLEQTHSLAEAFYEIQRVTPNIWPTVSWRITSRFGYRQDPFTKRKSYHTGIDIGGQLNDPVYAAAGKVTAAGYQRGMGYYVTLDHGNGLQTRYMHLNKILVQQGTVVEKGQRIGLLGNTGRSTGPHLHYEIIRYGQFVDPLLYFNGTTP